MKSIKRNAFLIAIITLTSLALGISSAHAGYSVCVLRDMDDQLVTAGSPCGAPGNYDYPTRVWGHTLSSYGSGTDTYFYYNNPGIVAPEDANELGTGFQLLPVETNVFFNFKAFSLAGDTQTNLAYWNGSGEVNFAPVSSGYTMEIYKQIGPETFNAEVDGAAEDVTGFAVSKTCDAGGIHEHPNYCLEGDGFAPAEGFYLFSMEIAMPGMKTTEPYFVVMETDGAPLALNTATAWVNDNLNTLTATVPEPSCLILLCSAGLGIACLRRNRK